jgi:hypothetical protein
VLPAAVDTYATSYHVGEVVGLLIVVGLALIVIRRALTRGSGRASAAPPPGDPGTLSGAASARRRRPRDVAIAIIAVAVAGAFVLSSVDRGLFDATAGGSWSTAEGVDERAGFIAGCGQGVPARTPGCECVFARISSTPPYNTPSGFAGLRTTIRRFEETRQPSAIPAAVVAAIRGCAGASHTGPGGAPGPLS